MLKHKVQIARESIKTTPELPGPLSGPWTPAECEFGSALVMCVLAHNLLRPPPPKWKSWIRPCWFIHALRLTTLANVLSIVEWGAPFNVFMTTLRRCLINSFFHSARIFFFINKFLIISQFGSFVIACLYLHHSSYEDTFQKEAGYVQLIVFRI